ncbi:hypothetical protein K3495_g1990 [Podosphaera aphanis]|nr:hypothetical protein K3495_g1990 [Podosphaera aphanis]
MSRGNPHPPLGTSYLNSSLHKSYTLPSIDLSLSPSILVWSDASSQSSDGSSVTSDSFEPQMSPQCQLMEDAFTYDLSLSAPTCEPSLKFPARNIPDKRVSCLQSPKNQYDQKISFVDSLVDSSAQIVEAIWPQSSASWRCDTGGDSVLPLRTFIQETLRRSRTSYSTLQVTLYYLVLVKPRVLDLNSSTVQQKSTSSHAALHCGRRMFLAALILASKYLQDRNYSARAWSKISGLNVLEINQNEISFLIAVNWQLHITNLIFQRWTKIVLKYTSMSMLYVGATGRKPGEISYDLKSIILHINPDLDNLDSINPPAQIYRAETSSHPPQLLFDCRSSHIGTKISYSMLDTCAPCILEPSHSPSCNSTRTVPALGLLPTPKLTPNNFKFSEPRFGALPMVTKSSSRHSKLASNVPSTQITRKLKTLYDTPIQSINSHRQDSTKISSLTLIRSESTISRDPSQSSCATWTMPTVGMNSMASTREVNGHIWLQSTKKCSSEHFAGSKVACQELGIEQGPTLSCESHNEPLITRFRIPSMSAHTSFTRQKPEELYSERDEAARVLQGLHSHPRYADHQSRAVKNSGNQGRNLMGSSTKPCWQPLLRKRSSSEFENPIATKAPNNNPDLKFIADPFTFGASSSRKRICCATEASLSIPRSRLHSVYGALDSFGM